MAKKPVKIQFDIKKVEHKNPELMERFRQALSSAVNEGHIDAEPDKETVKSLLDQGSKIFLASNLRTKEPLGFGIVDPPARTQTIMHKGISKQKQSIFPKLWFFKFLYSKKPGQGIGSAILDKIHRDLISEGAIGLWSFPVSETGLKFSETMKRKGYSVFDIGKRKGLETVPVKIRDFESNESSDDEIYARIMIKEFGRRKSQAPEPRRV